MLRADRYQLVPPNETSSCQVCNARYLPRLEFVSFNTGAAGEGEVLRRRRAGYRPAGLVPDELEVPT